MKVIPLAATYEAPSYANVPNELGHTFARVNRISTDARHKRASPEAGMSNDDHSKPGLKAVSKRESRAASQKFWSELVTLLSSALGEAHGNYQHAMIGCVAMREPECSNARRELKSKRAAAESSFSLASRAITKRMGQGVSDRASRDAIQADAMPSIRAYWQMVRMHATAYDNLPPIASEAQRATQSSSTPPLSTLLDWEILPSEALPTGGGQTFGVATPSQTRGEQPRRLLLLDSLNPKRWYRGSSLGTRVYFVAVFEGIAIADAVDFGNALFYYTGTDNEWMKVFRRDKREARVLGAKRLVHTGDWEERVRRLVGTTHERAR